MPRMNMPPTAELTRATKTATAVRAFGFRGTHLERVVVGLWDDMMTRHCFFRRTRYRQSVVL